MEIIKDILAKTKNDKLDPLSVIVKLFIYAYKPVGTKISIHNNKIHIQENGLFQGTIRTIYGDSKNDINIIFFPTIFACKYYLSEDIKFDKNFTLLFEKLAEAFDKLKETYQSSEIIYNIDQLKNIVQSLIKHNDFDLNGLATTYNSSAGKIKQDIYKHISTVWTENRLNVLFGYIDEIIELSTNNAQIELINNLIDSLNSYMNCIDHLVYNIINSIN
jgi:hypothetical protein